VVAGGGAFEGFLDIYYHKFSETDIDKKNDTRAHLVWMYCFRVIRPTKP
jgi:hypothetical protein